MYRSWIVNSVKTEIFFGALELGLFTALDSPISAAELHCRTGYDIRNLTLCLDALAAVKLISKDGGSYCNTARSLKYLSAGSPSYIGDLILHRRKMMKCESLADRIKDGNQTRGNEIDFKRLAELTGKEMKLFRVKAFIRAADKLLKGVPHPRVLDLGGGPGLMTLEWTKRHPGASGVIFERKAVAGIAGQKVIEYGAEEKVRVIAGDFLSDDIGDRYDLILASGVLAFCGDRLADIIKKLYRSLNEGGYVIVVTPRLNENGIDPIDTVLSWLSSRLDGIDPLLNGQIIHEEFLKAGFEYVNNYHEPLYRGAIYGKG